MIPPAIRFEPYETKLHEKRNERLSEQRQIERLKCKRPEWTALTSGAGHFNRQMVTLDQVR